MDAGTKVFLQLLGWVALILVCELSALAISADQPVLRIAVMLMGAAALWKLASRLVELATSRKRTAYNFEASVMDA
jgi:hypothetical protein